MPDRLTARELETLCAIAEAAGREIMAVYAGDFASWSKADASPLTEADLRADKVIREGLEHAFPGVFILSEESSTAGAARPDTFFLVDPLDGTKEFLKRNDEFTVNIALVHGGRPVAGVVLAPALGELYFAGEGVGAWKRTGAGTVALKVAGHDAGRPLRVMGSRSHGGEATGAVAGTPGLRTQFRGSGKFAEVLPHRRRPGRHLSAPRPDQPVGHGRRAGGAGTGRRRRAGPAGAAAALWPGPADAQSFLHRSGGRRAAVRDPGRAGGGLTPGGAGGPAAAGEGTLRQSPHL